MAATVVFLTSGTSYTIPADWNSSNNSIEVIGAGGGGGSNERAGGGGGAYSKVTNLSLTGSIPYVVGSGGAFGAPGSDGTDTYFNPNQFSNSSLSSDANLVSYYKLEDTSDSKGSNTLTNNGSISFNPAKYANGADLGTSNSTKYLNNNSAVLDLRSDYTISFWAKLQTEIGSGIYEFLHLENNTNKHVLYLKYEYNGGTRRLNFQQDRWVLAGASPLYTVTLGTSNYNHFTLTKSGTTLQIYFNGLPVGSTATVDNAVGDTTTNNQLLIGAGSVVGSATIQNYSSAIIDDVEIFSRALTATEVLSIYEQSSVMAKGGKGGNISAASGGASSSGIGSTKYSGGNSGADSGNTGDGGSGGGGAAGPSGAGNNGSANSTATGGAGGAGDTGSGGAAGAAGSIGNPGGAGGNGTNAWTSNPGAVTAGSGGGGGGGANLFAGGAAGNYGGGGGGGGTSANGANGANGFIVVTYTPNIAPFSRIIIMDQAVNRSYTY